MKKYLQSIKRCANYRKKILQLSQKVSALHIGGAFSSVEIIDAIFNILKKKRDRFILSKGHAGILQYVVLNDIGLISDKTLHNYCTRDGILGVHPDYGNPGIEASTGSLGHGLGIASGLAYGEKNKDIYVLMSDGELQEGSVWEALLSISSLKIKNIIVIVDNNGLQSSTWAKDTHPTLNPIQKKFISFGWDAKSCNGHKTLEIVNKVSKRNKKKPFALIANTIKGYPISFMKNNPIWHYRSPVRDEYLKALKELNSL